MSVEVTVRVGHGLLLELPMQRYCAWCLGPVEEHAGFFECACGPCFVLTLLGTFNSVGQTYALVQPELPEPMLPCFEPEPEA